MNNATAWVRTVAGVPFSSSQKGYVAEYNKTNAKGLSAKEMGTNGKRNRRRK